MATTLSTSSTPNISHSFPTSILLDAQCEYKVPLNTIWMKEEERQFDMFAPCSISTKMGVFACSISIHENENYFFWRIGLQVCSVCPSQASRYLPCRRKSSYLVQIWSHPLLIWHRPLIILKLELHVHVDLLLLSLHVSTSWLFAANTSFN